MYIQNLAIKVQTAKDVAENIANVIHETARQTTKTQQRLWTPQESIHIEFVVSMHLGICSAHNVWQIHCRTTMTTIHLSET